MSPSAGRWGRLAVSAAALGTLALVLDPARILDRLGQLRPGWVAFALGLSVVQVAVSAWRWRFTARQLGAPLTAGRALGEYYLAAFLNQVLPGGVVGDVSRAWRHARAGRGADGEARAAVNAVIVERASGQVVMTAAAVASAVVLLRERWGAGLIAAAAVAVMAGAWAAPRGWRRLRQVPALRALHEDLRRGLLSRRAFPAQALSSLVVVASYVGVFLAGAVAAGATVSPLALAPLVPPVLVTMLLPVSVAGWGIREAAAAALWGAAGLAPEEGVAISVTYGLLVLVSTLPGAAVLLFSPRSSRDPGRTGDPSPG